LPKYEGNNLKNEREIKAHNIENLYSKIEKVILILNAVSDTSPFVEQVSQKEISNNDNLGRDPESKR